MSDTSSSWSSVEDEAETRASFKTTKSILRWLALGLEALGGGLVIATAIYVRFADLKTSLPELNWKQICVDSSLSANIANNDNSLPLYIMVLVIPSLFILIGELEYTFFSKIWFGKGMTKMQKLCSTFPRTGRIFAMFILGIMIVSFAADYLQILIVHPRPDFLTKFGKQCPSPYNGTKTDDFYDSLKSFPNHLASVAGFCCWFAAGYAHKIHRSRTTPVLLPILGQAFSVLAVTVGLDQYTARYAHLSDVAVGLLLGLLLASYMSSLVSSIIRPKSANAQDQRSWPNFLDFMIPRVSLPPTNTAEALNFSKAHSLQQSNI